MDSWGTERTFTHEGLTITVELEHSRFPRRRVSAKAKDVHYSEFVDWVVWDDHACGQIWMPGFLQRATASAAKQRADQAAKQPWQMTSKEWYDAYSATRPDYVQTMFTRNSASEAASNAKRASWLRFGVCDQASTRMRAAMKGEIKLTPDELETIDLRLRTPVDFFDVIEKAINEGLPVPDFNRSYYEQHRPKPEEESEPDAGIAMRMRR